MTRRTSCAYCPTPAVARVQATGPGGGESRQVAACPGHLARASRWCAGVGPVGVDALPGGWVQLALDDALPAARS